MKWRESTFALPLLIGLLGALGLFTALLGDGIWDALSWLGLGIPAALGVWPLLRRFRVLPSRGPRATRRRP